ncbi:hypothetical protein GCM10029978_103050 [Actinoallomurus acanthiterrae]
MDAAGWTNNATATRPVSRDGTASGTNVTMIPAPSAVAAKTSVGRTRAAEREAGHDPDRPFGPGFAPGQSRNDDERCQRHDGGGAADRGVPDVPGEPHPQGQGHERRDAGHDAGEGETLTPPLRGDQRHRQRGARDDRERESQAAYEADHDDPRQTPRGGQDERGRAEKGQPARQHAAVAVSGDEPWGRQLANDGGQHERARRQAGGARARGRGRVEGNDRQQQEEARRGADHGDETQGQRPAQERWSRRRGRGPGDHRGAHERDGMRKADRR